ncbi:hypothetical protein TSOC_002740 [Tetrabaena socialis]|uniref:SF3 helicase domain-containing protein n=1 Tax=Tetrabaena socialis TaxID=47790 RepID=A0A2J8ADC5_9CHLO|nr:hypothetical protein TSOC_002740 [Tetrabaena socialis]|eukprot:PNH10520.1 hypothetical protein TSOC_002740 [Tetrabaena socialis]
MIEDLLSRIGTICAELKAKYNGRCMIDVEESDMKELIAESCSMYSALHAEGMLDEGSQKQRIENAMQILYYVEQARSTSMIASRLASVGIDAEDSSVSNDELAAGLAPFCKMELEQDVNKFQQLLLFLLNSLQHRGYKRFGTDCYEQLYTRDGYNTRAWTQSCSLKDFVYAMTRKETNFDQWLNLTQSKGNAACAADYLASCQDVQFPVLVKNRNIFSFQNGVYDTKKDRFYPYHAGNLPADQVACKYFDLPFDESTVSLDHWYTIPTPHMQSILDFQEFDTEVCRWMYIMMGRLMYNLNDLDRWQVIPYLKGQASSGKSTILLRVCRNLYDKADVGVLSNNIEKKFGIGAFSDKYLFVAPEIKADLQMEQAEFQSMVSGEDMSICIKYQTAHTEEWKVPGIMAGNEVPGWVDNSGSITRRIILFDFQKRVDNADMELGKKLENEMANLIKKCNKAYLWAAREYAKDNIWKHLPKYFHMTREDLSENTNVLEHFLKSNAIKFGSDAYMPWNDFLSAFQNHTRSHNFKSTANFTKDYYAAAFMRYSLKKSGKESRTYRGGYYNKVWLEGADVQDHPDQDL